MKRIRSDSLLFEILEKLKNKGFSLYIDNFASSLNISKVSSKRKLEKIAFNIFETTSVFNIKLSTFWILQKHNTKNNGSSLPV